MIESNQPPRSCPGCGARAEKGEPQATTYVCGARFAKVAGENSPWQMDDHSPLVSEIIPDELSFKINLTIGAAATEEEVIQMVLAWSQLRGIPVKGRVHKRRCVSTNLEHGIRWEVRFYGTFGQNHANHIDQIRNLGSYLANYFGQKEFRFVYDGRTYRVELRPKA